MKNSMLITLLVFALCVAVGHGRRDRRRSNGVPSDAENVVSWNRDLGSNTVQEYSFTRPGSVDQLFLYSLDKRNLKKAGFKKSAAIYDFTNGVSVVVLKVKRQCFVLAKPQNLTRDGVMQHLAALNGTTRDATSLVQMYITDLNNESITEIRNRPYLSGECRKLKGLTTTAPAEGVPSTKTYKVTSPDDLVIITKVKMPRRERGQGSRRRGQGSRRQRG